jgi:transcriptional regulator with PAS, ATPase and Fis domain
MEMNWAGELSAAITVCDTQGKIIFMNDRSAEIFSNDGGRDLLGSNLLNCHPEPAKSKLRELLENPRPNIYTIEKKGVRKMIYQTPWTNEGKFAGLVEISFQIPDEIPHFIRG